MTPNSEEGNDRMIRDPIKKRMGGITELINVDREKIPLTCTTHPASGCPLGKVKFKRNLIYITAPFFVMDPGGGVTDTIPTITRYTSFCRCVCMVLILKIILRYAARSKEG